MNTHGLIPILWLLAMAAGVWTLGFILAGTDTAYTMKMRARTVETSSSTYELIYGTIPVHQSNDPGSGLTPE